MWHPIVWVGCWGIYIKCDLAEVFKRRFWMMLHGGPCPKPTICWSNDEHVVDGLDRGPAFYCYIRDFSRFHVLKHLWCLGPWNLKSWKEESLHHYYDHSCLRLWLYGSECFDKLTTWSVSVMPNWGKYHSKKDGKLRFQGTPALRSSQTLPQVVNSYGAI